jgi:hypothetical protein
VKSISDHWSAGVSFWYDWDTFKNISSNKGVAPAVEYNLFPYSESTRRELRSLYLLHYRDRAYVDTTLYDKIAEKLLYQSLDITLELTERWGLVETTLSAANYLHDFKKNMLSFRVNLSLRLFRGLSVDFSGQYSAVHDQIHLAKGGGSEEDILLRRKEQATNYRYSSSIGISYTFGSIYSNVVNPRFGN